MESTLMNKEKNVESIKYFFDENEVKEKERKIIQSLRQRVNIPGFRKGRAPEKVLRMRLGEEYIRYSIADDFIDELAKKIVKEKADKLLLQPFVVDYKFNDGKLEIEIELHYKPEVNLPDYKNFKLEIPKPEDKNLEKYVENKLNDLREENVVLKPKEGKVEIGDLVKLNYKVLNEEGNEIYRSKTFDIVIREDDLRPIVQEVIGAKKGEKITFERDFETENGENKKFVYHVEIEEVYKRILPDLNDEFVRTVSQEFQNLEELKKSLKEEGEKLYEYYREEFLVQQALDKLASETTVNVTEKTLDRLVELAINKMKESGDYDEELKKFNNDEKALSEEIKKSYTNMFKETYSVNKVAEVEGVKVEESEIDESLKELSKAWNVSFERAKAMVKKDERLFKDIYNDILRSKVGKLIVENAEIVEIEKYEEKENGPEGVNNESKEEQR